VKRKFFSVVLIAVALVSCKRENPSPEGDVPATGNLNIAAKDLVVPATFNFQTEKELSVSVKVSDAKPTERYIIKVYNDVPSTGDLITTGITNINGEYKTIVRVPAWEEFIFIEKINPDGSQYFEKVKANQFVSTLFNSNNPQSPYIIRKTSSGMTCNSGCTRTVNNHTGNEIVNNGETVCFKGTINGSITIRGGGAIKVCANGTITGLTMDGNAQAYILENTILTISNVNTNGSKTVFKTWSDSLTSSGTISLNGTIENRGKMYINGDLNIQSNGNAKNYGDINITSNFNVDKIFKNYHFITVNGTMNNNSNADFENYCFLWVKQNLNNNGDMWNNCFIKVGQTYTQNSSGDTELNNGGIIFATNLMVNKDFEGTGSNRSKIKVSGTTTINNNGKIKGKIDLCDANGVETNNGSITSPAALSCSGYIAPSTCFPDGFGNPPVSDCDNDGIPDTQDEYPCDPERAFNSYYPSANKTATLAFEDLWPATGDYDYNDLVLAFNIQKVLNADNKVVDYKVKLKVLAVGAAYVNGFGWQFDELVPNDINTVTGQTLIHNLVTRNANNTEAGQTKAVIIAYDSPEPSMQRATGSMFNTIKENPTGTSDTIYININFTSPVLDSKLDISKFNPFIFTNKNRDAEIHLGNFKPTDLANTSMFGQRNDRSKPSEGIYYKTANGMPWAILLPNNFVYPKEYTSITSAYNFFDDWAASGGTSNTNWYTDAPGNRNIINLFGLQ
jgi:LruC domain-containing protein